MASKLNQKRIEEDRQTHERHQSLQAQGQQMQAKQLQDLMQNPQVFELLTKPDLEHKDQTTEDIAAEHLHVDQVLSVLEDDDLWRKGWKNKIWTTRIQMSYPFAESRTSDEMVNEVQRRIHGHDKRPLTSDESRSIEATLEQKTDREKRAGSGEFVELLLSQVVESKEQSNDSGSSGGLLPFGGN